MNDYCSFVRACLLELVTMANEMEKPERHTENKESSWAVLDSIFDR